MSKLLVIESSPRGDASISRILTATFVKEWKAAHPGGDVVERDLILTPPPFVNQAWVAASFTPPDKQSPEMKEALQLSNEWVAELFDASHIVIGTPVHNYMVSAALKAYVDQIVRRGLTLGSQNEGPVHGKKCTVLLASGGIYTEGSPIHDRDFASHWLRLILKCIGIEDVTFVAAGGTRAVILGERPLDEFLAEFEPAVIAAAQA